MIKGGPALQRVLASTARDADELVESVLDQGARQIHGRAVALSPELTRKLILSSRVTRARRRGRSARVISFDTDYAVVMHEAFYNLGPISSRKAPTQDGPVGRKYLERPFNRVVPDVIRAIGLIPERAARRNRRRGR